MSLINSFEKTNLDIENRNPGGFFNKDLVTSYASTTTGTPTTTANPGPTKRFIQPYRPDFTYIQNNPIRGIGLLQSTVANTNLDTSDSRPEGGIPYKTFNDPTNYPITAQAKSTIKGYFPTSGKLSSKFIQVWSPQKTYLDFINK